MSTFEANTPRAIVRALTLIRSETGKRIPDYRVSFVLSTEPDQYRVSYTDPRPSDPDREFNLVRTLTLTSHDFEAWQAWLDSAPEGIS